MWQIDTPSANKTIIDVEFAYRHHIFTGIHANFHAKMSILFGSQCFFLSHVEFNFKASERKNPNGFCFFQFCALTSFLFDLPSVCRLKYIVHSINWICNVETCKIQVKKYMFPFWPNAAASCSYCVYPKRYLFGWFDGMKSGLASTGKCASFEIYPGIKSRFRACFHTYERQCFSTWM